MTVLASLPLSSLSSLRRLSLRMRVPMNAQQPMDMTMVLMRCINVEELDLEGTDYCMPFHSNVEPFAMPRLRSLGANCSLITGFRRLISTPELESLNIYHGSDSGVDNTTLRPLSRKLHTLTNNHCWAYVDEPRKYIEIYEAHPTVHILSIDSTHYEGTLTSLCEKLPSATFGSPKPAEYTLPALKVLKFKMFASEGNNIRLEPLLRVLERRTSLRIIFEVAGRQYRVNEEALGGLKLLKEKFGERLAILGVLGIDEAGAVSR